MKIKSAAIILTLFFILAIPAAAVASDSESKLSPAFDIIANELSLVKTGIVSSDINFTAEDFDRALGVKKVESVTITSLPSITEGKLMLGSVEVMKNQTISRGNLDLLRFVPSGASNTAAETTFGFYSGYPLKCTVYVLSELNFAPTAALSGGSFTNLTTYKNITAYGTMKASDPENDKLTYEIATQPKKGVLKVTDKNYGNYTYTPTAGFTGKDSFEYVVYDKYGNSSEKVKISVTVEKNKTDVVYTDMSGHWAHNAAIKMAEANIMTGEKIGESMYFDPSATVSRCEFLVMAMNAIGYNYAASAVDTGFADDDAIPSQYKGYISAAVQLGFVKGYDTDNNGAVNFNPNNDITRAEAAVMLNNMLDSKQPVVKPAFADETSVPAWAEDAIYAMNELGIMNGMGEGYMSPYTALTRAQTAQILYSVIELDKN